jgi:TolB-like protein
MKKIILAAVFIFTAWTVFSQRLSSVAVFPFEVSGTNLNEADAAALTERLIGELQSWGTLNIVPAGDASAEYLVKGQLSRQNNQVVLSATTYSAQTNKALNTAKEQGAAANALFDQIFSLAAQVTENIPFPNYLLGRWRSVINLNEGPLVCTIEFRSDRTVRIQQYDTWERRGNNSLMYQGFGTGTYSYWGHARRTVRGMPVDGFVTLNLKLEDALPKYTAVSFSRVNLYFDEEKNNFELVNSGFTCGDDFSKSDSGTAVAYTKFTKIQ